MDMWKIAGTQFSPVFSHYSGLECGWREFRDGLHIHP
jgi:hypothetical protein